MGVDAVDVDDDGDLDLLVVNLDGESDSFFRNRGGFFSDDTAAVGLRTASRPFTRFGVAFVRFRQRRVPRLVRGERPRGHAVGALRT